MQALDRMVAGISMPPMCGVEQIRGFHDLAGL